MKQNNQDVNPNNDFLDTLSMNTKIDNESKSMKKNHMNGAI